MSAVLHLIRHAPREGLQAFFDAERCPLGDRLRSFGLNAGHAAPLLKAVDDLNNGEHGQLTVNAGLAPGGVPRAATRAFSHWTPPAGLPPPGIRLNLLIRDERFQQSQRRSRG